MFLWLLLTQCRKSFIVCLWRNQLIKLKVSFRTVLHKWQTQILPEIYTDKGMWCDFLTEIRWSPINKTKVVQCDSLHHCITNSTLLLLERGGGGGEDFVGELDYRVLVSWLVIYMRPILTKGVLSLRPIRATGKEVRDSSRYVIYLLSYFNRPEFLLISFKNASSIQM